MEQKGIRMTKIAMVVLKVIAVAGFLTMAICAPNALQVLGMFDKNRRRPAQVNRVLRRLVHQKLVRVFNDQNKQYVELTKKGEQYLAEYEDGHKIFPKPKKWDGKYRILIFDIWERRRQVRDELREWLRRFGFLHLQDSVWVYPYDCEEIITLLKTRFRVGNGLLSIVAESIENDRWLRKEFGLSF